MVKLYEDSQVIICALLQHKFERMKTLKGQNYIKLDLDSFLTSSIRQVQSKTKLGASYMRPNCTEKYENYLPKVNPKFALNK